MAHLLGYLRRSVGVRALLLLPGADYPILLAAEGNAPLLSIDRDLYRLMPFFVTLVVHLLRLVHGAN